MKSIKIFLLITVMFLITLLSHTPSLQVSNPSSWFNEPSFKNNASLNSILQKGSDFYRPYGKIIQKEFLLHKLSHILFYSLLSYLVFINTYLFKKLFIRFFITITFITIFALTDEIHQAFIFGRSGRLMDVILDSLAGLITSVVIFFYYNKKRTIEK